MKLLKLCLVAAGLLLVAGSSQAQEYTTTQDNKEGKYFANEFTFDAFGGYIHNFNKFNDAFDRSWQHGKWGGGVGLNYFFLRYLGVGAETFMQENGKLINNVSGDLTLRYPICDSGLAPYIFGTGGRRFYDPTQWFYGGGVGLEYRFTRHVGIFTDARYLWHSNDGATDRALVRAGMRFAF